MSAAGRYRYLFSPLRVGPVVVRNRIVFAAHLTNYAQDGSQRPSTRLTTRPGRLAAPGCSSPRSIRPTPPTGHTKS